VDIVLVNSECPVLALKTSSWASAKSYLVHLKCSPPSTLVGGRFPLPRYKTSIKLKPEAMKGLYVLPSKTQGHHFTKNVAVK
jgi:hypothetical protein